MFVLGIFNQFVFFCVSWDNDLVGNMFVCGFNMVIVGGILVYLIMDDYIYYYVFNKWVNIYYNDMILNGLLVYFLGYNVSFLKIVVDLENFYYKVLKVFLEFFSFGNCYFQFKGWYKGFVRLVDLKVVKLEILLMLEFDVIYDGVDNLYVFYDEVKEMIIIILEVIYKFGFVDEKGVFVVLMNVDIQVNLIIVEDKVVQKVGVIIGVNVGNLKQLIVFS